VNHDELFPADVVIADGLVERMVRGDSGGNDKSHELENPDHQFDDNHLIFPGFIDVHVHAREDKSGTHVHKEDFVTVSQAALNGGVIAVADMPNNPISPINDESYRRKKTLTEKASIPILLYAGIGPNTSPLLVNVPYKAFMGPSVGDLFFSSFSELEKAIARYQDQVVSFHCEDPNILERNKHLLLHEERRPAEAEIEAVKLAIELTRRYNLETKICHLSTAEGIKLCGEAKEDGLNLTVEVSPHHLYFDQSMLNDDNRKFLQVNPPVRTSRDRLALLEALKKGEIDYIATDHAPHTLTEKQTGISGMPHLDTYGLFVAWLIKEQGVKPEIIARVCSYNPGLFMNRFLGTKFGKIEAGYEAKFTVIDFSKNTLVNKSYLKTKCAWSPFEKVTFPGRVNVFL